jgi:RNA polymerase sigma factor (sigma-70 family)
MQDPDDIALLREYVTRQSEDAFAALVSRHINKVYSVALRHTRNPHAAEEITQAVFVILARKARHLSPRVILSGWLYQTARLTALTFIRGQVRRARREQEAHVQTLLNEPGPDVWPQIAPLLDAAMTGLSERDRHAVVLRYFDGKSMKEVGTALNASEDAAKMRVNRAVDKLRRFFNRRGLVLSAGVLTAAISANSVQAAPVTIAKTATTIALAKGTAGASTLTLVKGALKLMFWSKAKTAAIAGAVVLLTAGTGVVVVGAVNWSFFGAGPDISGTWEGRMMIQEPGVNDGELASTRVVLKLAKSNGVYAATTDWIDLGRKDVREGTVSYSFPSLRIVHNPRDTWTIKVNADAKQMLLNHFLYFTQSYPVLLTRTTTPDAVPEPLTEADFQPRPGSDLQGYWKGAITSDAIPVDVKIAELPDGTFRAEGDDPMQGANGRPVTISYTRPDVKLAVGTGSGMFAGKLNADHSQISGVWTQGGQVTRTVLKRADYQAEHAHDAERDYSFSSDNDLPGHWRGAWVFGTAKIRLALDIAKMPDGTWCATLASLDQFGNDAPMPASSIEFRPPDLRLKWKWAEVAYEGKLQGGKLTGAWLQGGGGFPLVFERQR